MSRFFRSRWTAAVAGIAVLAVAVILFTGKNAAADDTGLITHVVRGDFKAVVTTAGDLRAKNFVQITPPMNADRAGAYQMKIASIIPEGTMVQKGDTVAELDRSPLMTQLNNVNLSMARAQAVFDQAQLDTTLNLSKAREDLRLSGVALEERKIGKEQAMYEAPSVKRQAQIDYDKADRALAQGTKDYVTRESQAKAKMREVSADVERNRIQQTMIQDVMKNFTVVAPGPGMLIYARDYSGKKRAAGSFIYYSDGSVAQLPDLSKMESLTYVNEVDVRRVAVGQPVTLTLDSDPTKHLTGKVISVANIGEERPNSDAKVFEVKIEVIESDTTLRPGMTTSSSIETLSLKNVLAVPLEAVTSEGNVPYVFKKDGGTIVKQEIETSAFNDTHVVITKGLSEGDAVLLVPPPDHATMPATRLPGSTAGQTPKAVDAPKAKTVPLTPPAKDAKATKDGKGAPAKTSGRQ